MKNLILWLTIPLFLAGYLCARDVPFFLKTIESNRDVGNINNNFRSLSSDIKRIENKLMFESNTCELDTPARLGTFCFDTSDRKLYISTATNSVGFMVVGQQ